MRKEAFIFVLLSTAGAWLLFLQSCDEPKPNPCIGKELLNADFTIGQRINVPNRHSFSGGIDTLIRVDTILVDDAAQFEAKHDNMTYEWKIGEDTRTWNTKKVTLAFRNFSGSVTIRLITKWTPNLQCFPKDDGVDTVYRTLTVIEYKDNPVFGGFEGYNLSNKSDVFRIKMIYLPRRPWSGLLTDINKGCDASGGSEGEYGQIAYRRFFFVGGDDTSLGGNCLSPRGILVVSPDGKNVRVDFSTLANAPNSKRVKDVFVGRRVN
jgi:hypothetical protein